MRHAFAAACEGRNYGKAQNKTHPKKRTEASRTWEQSKSAVFDKPSVCQFSTNVRPPRQAVRGVVMFGASLGIQNDSRYAISNFFRVATLCPIQLINLRLAAPCGDLPMRQPIAACSAPIWPPASAESKG